MTLKSNYVEYLVTRIIRRCALYIDHSAVTTLVLSVCEDAQQILVYDSLV